MGCGDQIDCDKQELVVSDNSLSCLPAQIATLSSLSYLRFTLNTLHGLDNVSVLWHLNISLVSL